MDRNFLFGLLVGVAAGAATGVLLTPRTGREVRTDIKVRSRDAVGRIGKTVSIVTGKREEAEFRLKPSM